MGNSGEQARDRTQSRVILSANLTRVNEAAKRSRQTRFTALLHHVDVAALERAYRRLRRQAAPGVDGVTVESYGQDLEDNLRDLADRSMAAAIGRCRFAGRTSQRLTAVSGLSASSRWKIKSSRARWRKS
jgi:hypothetical protein